MRTSKAIQIKILCLFLLVLGFQAIQAAEPAAGTARETLPYSLGIPVFPNEQALKFWIRERLPLSKLVELEREGRRVCIALAPVGTGRFVTTVYIFITDRTSGAWGVAAVWQTYTSEVNVYPPKGGKELTFKSKSGKVLFRVPFEALEPKTNSDY